MNKNNVIVITGQRGTGKTTYIKNCLRGMDRIIIFDLLGEFDPNVFTMRRFFEQLSQDRKNPFFVLSYFNPRNSEDDFELICKAVNRMSNIILVIDELDYFCSPTSCPDVFAEIIKRGRHQEIGVICATRRPHEIPRLVTSQVTELVTFRHVEPRDLAYLKDIGNFEPEEVQKLPDFSYLKWNQGEVERGEVSLPKASKKKRSADLAGEEENFEKMFKEIKEDNL